MITNYLIFAIGIFTLFNVFTISKSEGLQCMGEDGKPVDWYIIYKLPKLEKVKGSTQEEDDERGLKYLYMSSSKMRSPGWKYPGKLITDIDSFPGMTLKPLYAEGKTDQIWILYNDQPPEGSKVKGTPGHTKGVVATNKDGGFWIVHSVPRFPNVPSSGEYNYTESGRNNGQTMLCMTLKSTEMEKVATQLQYNQAGVYYSFFTQTMESQFPTLVNVAKKLTTKLPDNSHIVELKTVGNKVFKSFAKNREFNDDLYDKLVAPELKVDMQVETWRNGGGTPLPSDCQADYKVMNIESLNLCVKKECDLFPSTKDHSKWASSVESASPWVCIGDINRAKSQSGRGGGTVCINNKLVWNAFSSAVNGLQACDAKPKSPKSTKSTIPTVEIVQ